jgi:hypothetical protein
MALIPKWVWFLTIVVLLTISFFEVVGANVQSEIGVWQKIKYLNFICCSLFAKILFLIALVVHFVHDILFFVLYISIVGINLQHHIMLIDTPHECKKLKYQYYANKHMVTK